MESGKYRTFVLYNEANGLRLYAVDCTTSFLDCVLIFLSASDMEWWIETNSDLLKHYDIMLEFSEDKAPRYNILNMYETAKELLVKNGKVYINDR